MKKSTDDPISPYIRVKNQLEAAARGELQLSEEELSRLRDIRQEYEWKFIECSNDFADEVTDVE